MTANRAKEIWAAKSHKPYMTDIRHLMTQDEHSFVMSIWQSMPGWTCYMDAFFSILNDRLPASKDAAQ